MCCSNKEWSCSLFKAKNKSWSGVDFSSRLERYPGVKDEEGTSIAPVSAEYGVLEATGVVLTFNLLGGDTAESRGFLGLEKLKRDIGWLSVAIVVDGYVDEIMTSTDSHKQTPYKSVHYPHTHPPPLREPPILHTHFMQSLSPEQQAFLASLDGQEHLYAGWVDGTDDEGKQSLVTQLQALDTQYPGMCG